MRYLSQSAEGVRSLRRESVSCVVEVLWRMEERAHPINQGEYSLVLDKIYTFVS